MKMTLSKAMREGAKMAPQEFGRFRGLDGGTCAWQAAVDYIDQPTLDISLEDRENLIASAGRKSKCPLNCTPKIGSTPGYFSPTFMYAGVMYGPEGTPTWGPVRDIIMHLNDTHRWTREQIADWLEATFEGPKEPAAEPMIPAAEIMAMVTAEVKEPALVGGPIK